MKRPANWLRSFGCAFAVWVGILFAGLLWAAPRVALWLLPLHFGSSVSVQSAGFTWPAGLKLRGVVFNQSDERSGASVQRVDVRLGGVDWAAKTLYFDVRLEQPSVRITRLRDAGAVLPAVTVSDWTKGFRIRAMQSQSPRFWSLSLRRLLIVDGALDILDRNTEPPFRSIAHHIHAVFTPVQEPFGPQPLSFSASAQLIGHMGHGAPLRCAGWLAPESIDAEISCHLESLRVTAFQPYFATFGRFTIREYVSTVQVTTDWLARRGSWNRRFQIVLDHVHEGDISFRGRTVVDFKELSKGLEPVFEGEINMSSSDHPSGGRIPGLFTPNNEVARRLVRFFLERNYPSLDLRFFGLPLRIFLERSAQTQTETQGMQGGLETFLFPLTDSKPPEGGAPGDAEYYGPFLPQGGSMPAERKGIQGAPSLPVRSPAH